MFLNPIREVVIKLGLGMIYSLFGLRHISLSPSNYNHMTNIPKFTIAYELLSRATIRCASCNLFFLLMWLM